MLQANQFNQRQTVPEARQARQLLNQRDLQEKRADAILNLSVGVLACRFTLGHW